MNGEKIFNSIKSVEKNIKKHKDEIEKLDQEIGDGDHIFNILRGLQEILNLEEELIAKPPDQIFKQLGMKIMTTVGGSSGALFATLLIGMSKKYNSESSDFFNLSQMFFEGVESMKKRGKADIGEKTMLDVLIPVSKTLNDLKIEEDISKVAEKIIFVAKEGMISTKDIIATKGRASFLGERAKGHIDPGARSSQLAIEAICNQFINN
jgi:phosphoenolpyruvate---glycerone phosphotransferase subunit DhaL|tara:strand:- start:489 stop:1112 length:624 start_codon:yes stop_codon:yes gene_type:complete